MQSALNKRAKIAHQKRELKSRRRGPADSLCEGGWLHFADPSNTQIQICESSCIVFGNIPYKVYKDIAFELILRKTKIGTSKVLTVPIDKVRPVSG